MSSLKLSGQRVLVTGAGRGIGRALARLCAAQGAQVALTARTASELQETAAPMAKSLIVPADITKEEDVDRLITRVVEEWGGIDVLINNAGGGQTSKAPLQGLPASELSRLLTLNVVSLHLVTSAVLQKAMKSGGRIVNVSSRAGKIGIPNMSSYVASKFAVEGLTAALAAEQKELGITVNSISPGMVDTKSFPKRPGAPGVRSPESVELGLWTILESDVTGCYLHVDELDMALEKGLPAAVALKPINEPSFADGIADK